MEIMFFFAFVVDDLLRFLSGGMPH